ncbi:MAG: TetR/AcrR family transcriptional regulator [Spirochaetia bacterium]|nr:TetR/AcrR family transcriptional regulator [Spirochaetia bacterium]
MPPRQRFSQQTIIDAAIRVIREQGPEALNARKLAGELGCSTQPLYSLFSSMEEIEQAVITACLPIPMEYMLGAEDRESQFLSIGMGYLQFAESEPGIFRLLFTSGKVQWDFTAGNPYFAPLLEKMRRDCFLASLTDGKLFSLLSKMFIFTHGLCTLQHSAGVSDTTGTMRTLLHETGGELIMTELLKQDHPEVLQQAAKEFMDVHTHT